jgi:hypothetical protein
MADQLEDFEASSTMFVIGRKVDDCVARRSRLLSWEV